MKVISNAGDDRGLSEVMRFELRSIHNLEVHSVRCKSTAEHESILRTHGKEWVMVRGHADFDCDQVTIQPEKSGFGEKKSLDYGDYSLG